MSKVAPVFFAKIFRDGKLHIDDRKGFDDHIRSLAPLKEDFREVGVLVKKKTKNRSNRQNAYYFGVVVEILRQDFGYEKDEMHDALRMKHLLDKTGKIPRIRSTTELSTVEFEEYMSEIRRWASKEWSVYIPMPNETEFDYDVRNI